MVSEQSFDQISILYDNCLSKVFVRVGRSKLLHFYHNDLGVQSNIGGTYTCKGNFKFCLIIDRLTGKEYALERI